MPTYLITFGWVVPIQINATAEITAGSEEEAERLFLETGGNPDKMTNLEVEYAWAFSPWNFIRNGHPIEVEDVQEATEEAR